MEENAKPQHELEPMCANSVPRKQPRTYRYIAQLLDKRFLWLSLGSQSLTTSTSEANSPTMGRILRRLG
eukprot:1030673-Amphidinium_carterae.1